MLHYVHIMICVICTVLRGRYCVIQHSCCNTNKAIIIVNCMLQLTCCRRRRTSYPACVCCETQACQTAVIRSRHHRSPVQFVNDSVPVQVGESTSRIRIQQRTPLAASPHDLALPSPSIYKTTQVSISSESVNEDPIRLRGLRQI